MRIRFIKRAKDLREGATKYHSQGAIYSMGSVLALKHIKNGDAVEDKESDELSGAMVAKKVIEQGKKKLEDKKLKEDGEI